MDSASGDETTEKQTITGNENAETRSTENDRLVMGHTEDKSEGKGREMNGTGTGTGNETIDAGEVKESGDGRKPMVTAADAEDVEKVNGDGGAHATETFTELDGTTQTLEKLEATDEAKGQAGALKPQAGLGDGNAGGQESTSDSRQQTPIVPAPIEVRKLVFNFIRSQIYYVLILLTFRALGQTGGNIQDDWFQRFRASRRREKDGAQDVIDKGNGGVQEGISDLQERHPGRIVSAPIEIRQHIFSFIRSRFDYIRLLSTCQALKRAGGSIRSDWFRRYCANRWYENDEETPRDSKSPMHRVSTASAKNLSWNFRHMEVIETLCKFDENLDAVETLDFKEAAEKLFEKEYETFRSLHGVPVSHIQTFSRVCGEPGPFLPLATTRDPLLVSRQLGHFSLNVCVKSPMNLFEVGDQIPVMSKLWGYRSDKERTKWLHLMAIDAIGNVLFGTIYWKVTLPSGRIVYDDGTLSSIFSKYTWKVVEGDHFSVMLEDCVPKHDFHALPTQARSHIPRAHFYLKHGNPFMELLGGQVLPYTFHAVVWNVELAAK
ncbi:hypothetical protein HK104_008832 [Borealophlyctis nickersoniae]|nr:hypothetical protein HK104_008832 [Borealophlyctis nickersoniae]